MKLLLHSFTCVILLFLKSCHCLGGPDVSMGCAAVDNSTIKMNDGRSYTERSTPILNYEETDTLFIEYYKGDRDVNVSLFFQKVPGKNLELDTMRSLISLLHNQFTTHDFKFIEHQLLLKTLTPNTCYLTYQGYEKNIPDIFQATISGKVKYEDEVKEVVIEVDVSNRERRSEEC